MREDLIKLAVEELKGCLYDTQIPYTWDDFNRDQGWFRPLPDHYVLDCTPEEQAEVRNRIDLNDPSIERYEY